MQPFLPAVKAGEVSLIYFRAPSATRSARSPAAVTTGSRRASAGTVAVHEPTPEELAVGAAALAALPPRPLYARIDMVGDRQPRLMEAELIEPELFLPLVAGAAERYARLLVARPSSSGERLRSLGRRRPKHHRLVNMA